MVENFDEGNMKNFVKILHLFQHSTVVIITLKTGFYNTAVHIDTV